MRRMTLDVSEIEAMDRATLLSAWSEIMNKPVPAHISQPMLRRILAFEAQARRRGGLPKGFVGKLEQAARQASRTSGGAPKPGARLMREWNGVTHVVDVGSDGFLWRGNRYRSLSAVARAITGAQWSGPRFFGLNRPSRS
jgi:hypothetical protein